MSGATAKHSPHKSNNIIMQRLSQFYLSVTVGLLALLLGACSLMPQPQPTVLADQFKPTPRTSVPSRTAFSMRAEPPLPSATPTPRAHVLGPRATPFLTFTPQLGATPVSTAAVLQLISVTTQIHSMSIANDSSGLFAPDQEFIYWISEFDSQLYRLPLAGGANELLARSQFNQYDDGYLWSGSLIRAGDRLIFRDARENDIGTWALHALNLQTKQDKIVMQETGSHAPMWSPMSEYSAEGEWLAWTRLELGSPTRCDQSILGMTNLDTGKERELERVCTADHYIWSIPHLSGEHLIVEQDLPDAQGRKNNILLWNWKTGERTALTTNGYSSMPAVSGKWVVWKEAPRYTASKNYIIYNLETGERQSFRGLKCWSDPRVSGHWLYSSVCKNTLTVYDLAQQRWVNVVQLPKGESFRGIALSDEWAVWGVARDSAAGKEYEIQWRRLP